MKLFLLALACAFAAASHVADPSWLNSMTPVERELSVRELKPGHEFQFVYEAQFATGIPGASDQHTAARMQAVCSLILESDNKAILRIVDARWGKIDERIPSPRRIMPFESFEHVPIEESMKTLFKLPVMFKYEQGMISELVFDGQEAPWTANIKRGVLNMLQVNLHKVRRVDRPDDLINTESIEHNNDFYTVIEPTLEGECETLYTVIDRPSKHFNGKRALNVTKSVNFDKCNKRPERRYNYRFEDMCPTCEKRYSAENRFVKSQTVSEVKLLCGEGKRRCLVNECRVESQYNVVPFGEDGNMITTYVNQLLVLAKSGPIVSEVRKPTNPIKSDSNMLATQDFEAGLERFRMTGRSDESEYYARHMVPTEKAVPMVKALLKKLVHYTRESVEEEAPRHFAKLVKLLTWIKPEALKQVHERFYQSPPTDFTPEEHQTIKSLLPDAVALCGTRPCVKHITQLIKNKQITGFKANSLIRKMIDTKVISEEIIKDIWEVSESTERKDLQHSVYLTVGSLLNGLCEPSRDRLALESKTDVNTFCPRSLKQHWTEKLIRKFEESTRIVDKIVCLKALANAGLQTSILPLEKIIRSSDKRYPTVIRTEAILALRQLREVMPHKIVRVLMPVVMNKKESTPVRITAFYEIIHCQPEKPVLDKLALMLNREPNKQVASFVYTTMHNMANTTIPCEKRMAKDLQQSLRLAKYVPVRSWLSYSKLMRAQWYNEKTNMGGAIDYTVMNSKNSMMPQALGVSLHKLFSGQWNKYLMTIGFSQYNVDETIRSYLRTYRHTIPSSLSDILSGKSVSSESNYRGEIKSMFESLKLNSRESMESSAEMGDMELRERQPFSYLYIRYLDQDYAVLPLIDNNLSRNMPEMLNLVKQALREGRSGPLSELVEKARTFLSDRSYPINVNHATFLERSERTIPTSMGLSLTITTKTPLVFKAHGLLNIDFDQSSPLNKIKLQLNNFKPSMVVTNVLKVQSFTPLSMHALKVLSKAKIFLPFSGHLSIDLLKPQPELSFMWQPEKDINGPVDIVRVQTRPVLVSTKYNFENFWQRWLQPEETTIRPTDFDRVNIFDKEIGSKFLGIKFSTRGKWHRTPKKSVPGTPMCPLSGPNKMVVTMEPGYEMPKEIKLILSGKLFEILEGGKLSPSGFKNFYSSEEKSSEEFLRESSEERGYKISEEYINKFESGTPIRHMLRVSFNTQGSPIKRSGSITTDCQCSERMRTCKCELKAERTPIPTVEQTDWKFEGIINTLYPNTPFTMSELKQMDNEKFHCDIKSKWGPRSSMDKHMNIKIVGDRSKVQKHRMERSVYRRLSELHRDEHRSLFSPVAQYKQLIKYSAFDEYKLKMSYKVSPYMRNITNYIYRSLKNYPRIFASSEVNQINPRNPEQEIKLKLNVDPINWRYVNVTVKSPIETLKVLDIALPARLPLVNMRRRSYPTTSWNELFNNMVYSSFRPVCEVRSDRVLTFDQVEYNVPITTCYSVLAKDCSSAERSQFAVLVKKVATGSEKKQVKIITPGTKLIVRLTESDRLECELNGQTKPCSEIRRETSHGHTVLKVKKTSPYVHIELPEVGIKVYFDGYACNVKVSPIYRNVVCGLCGGYDIETVLSEVERTPEGRLRLNRMNPESVRDYFGRYLLKQDEDCNVESEIVDSIRSYERRPLSWTRPVANQILENFGIRSNMDSEMNCEEYESCPNEWYRNEHPHTSDICDVEPRMCDRELKELSIDSPLRSLKRSHNIRPILKTKVLERGHDICFSQTPLPRCPPGTVSKSYEPERIKTAFTCLRRSDRLTEMYELEASRNRIVSSVSELKPTFAEEIIVPSTCRYL